MISLSDGEWKLMNVLWHSPPRTITQLVAALQEETGWSKHTVISMLGRLEQKGAVRHEQGERAKQFYPAIEQRQARREETESFLARLYGGSLGLLLNTLADSRGLSRQEVEELQEILRRAKEEKDD
ncbi:MAG: BlaI/MecI/CopY family transcriptional regulator [Provencibacterium sp.]|jgi:BlaI family penicillinase repressor|nr:BlaI/MecI/CopY family transcriptional regulator [Provencibacterium sp.]